MNLPSSLQENPPKFRRQDLFTVRSHACDGRMRLNLPGLINMLQEIAGLHANELNVGVQDLQKQNLTWMLSRMQISIKSDMPAWGEQLVVTTWPSGVKGRLSAVRDFIVETVSGDPVAEGLSEWLMIDLLSRRITKLTPQILELAVEGTHHVSLPDSDFPGDPIPVGNTEHTVRRADMDINCHVNNVHYTEWALESLLDDYLSTHTPELMEIIFKAEAVCGNRIRSESFVSSLASDSFHHDVSNAENQASFAKVFTRWRPL